MGPNASVQRAILAKVPELRAFAISLCRNRDRADDLVQETVLRAWANIDSFQPETNLSAWLFTIMRNHLRSEYRKRRHELEDLDGGYAESVTCQPEQETWLRLQELRAALGRLPINQREPLMLYASGCSYAEIARVCGSKVGTIKSRLNRGRIRLTELMSFDVYEFALDKTNCSMPVGNHRSSGIAH